MPRLVVPAIAVVCLLAAGACSDTTDDPGASASAVASPTAQASAATSPTAPASQAPREAETYTLAEGDDGKKLTLAVGDRVELTLETNPGTGYRWEYEDEPDPAVLEETSDRVSEAEASPGMVGVPVQRTWTYVAKGAGATTVKLGYVPPSGGSAEETFSFSVTVG